MAKYHLRSKAWALRRSGHTLQSVANQLGISKSTAITWCRALKLSAREKQDLKERARAAGNKGRLIGAAMNKQRKLDTIAKFESEGSAFFKTLTCEQLMMLGLGLYWGEGTKGDDTRVALANSNPLLVAIALRWFVECLGVSRDQFRPTIYLNESHRDREEVVRRYWYAALQLPECQFAKTCYIARESKKVYENRDSYYGVISLRVRAAAELKYRIMGLLGAIAEHAQKAEVAQPVRADVS